MSWAVGQRAMVIEDNIFDRIREGFERQGRDVGLPWAGCYGHVTRIRDFDMIDVHLEGSIHGQMPENVVKLEYWTFTSSELEHAD